MLKSVKLAHRRNDISYAKYLFNARYARVYFDFETTYDDTNDEINLDL